MKKFVTLIAALVLCFALCISASAYTASEALNATNAPTGTTEAAYGSRTVTAEVYPAGTTFSTGKYISGKDFCEFTVYDANNNYVSYCYPGSSFTLPDDGQVYCFSLFDGYSFSTEDVFVTSGAAAPAEPEAKVETMEISDSDTMNGTWTAKITGVFTERESLFAWCKAYDAVVEPDSIIEFYDGDSNKPCAYRTIYAYDWNGTEYVSNYTTFTAETGTAAEVFAACGNPDMLKFSDLYGSKEVYVTLAGVTPAAPAEPETPAEPAGAITVNGSTVVADLSYDGTLTVEGTVTENYSFTYVDAMWGMEDTCTGYLVEIDPGSTITASAGSVLVTPCYQKDDGTFQAPGDMSIMCTGTAEENFASVQVMLYRLSDGSGKYLILTLDGTLDQKTAAAPVESFTDVAKEDTFYDAIAYVTEKGLMSGVSETAFERKNPVSHKEIFGSLELAGADVAAAKAWAAEQALEDTAAATREDVITMLWIANGKQAADETKLNAFTDTATISAESKTAMAWAVEKGIVKGYSNGHLGAQVQLTRGAMAAILFRAASV